MRKKIIITILGLLIGFGCGFLLVSPFPNLSPKSTLSQLYKPLVQNEPQVIGFLPYWLVSKADKDYSKYITTLTYFGLTIGPDGKILKLVKQGEEDPGWTTLHTGKVDSFFADAKKNNISLSLLVFSSDEEMISRLIKNPVLHAQNLVNDVAPIMKQYDFDDLNLDIESVNPNASQEARLHFTQFVKELKKNLDQKNLGTLTIDASPTVLIKPYLIDLDDVGPIADKVVLMTYDFHYPGSYVTGPVAPIGGVGHDAEYDTETSIKEALKIMPAEKIIMGLPLYGYEWETTGATPRSAVIPGTGITASNRRVEELKASCTNCQEGTDANGEESYLIYQDQDTGTDHQIFYPDMAATEKKVALAKRYRIGGLALWALGYEGETILKPLTNYSN